jgi:hypothetical protein
MPKPAHLAIPAFMKDDAESRIDAVRRIAVTYFLSNAIEPRGSVVKLHTIDKLANLRRLRAAANAYEVFALDLAGWMHQPMS